MSDSAYILIETDGRDKDRILDALRSIDGVASAHSVGGAYDVVVYAVRPDRNR